MATERVGNAPRQAGRAAATADVPLDGHPDPAAAATVGFWELDLGTDELYWSTQVFEITGLREASMSAFRARVDPDDVALVDHVWVRAQAQPGPYRAEHRFHRGDEQRVLSHRIQSVPGEDGRPARLLGMVSDVTEIRSHQPDIDAAHSIRNIALVASSLVHDFKNQLAIVLGHTKLALDAVDGGDLPARESLEAIQRAATQGTDLTRQILELGRARPAAVGAVVPATVVERVAALARPIIGSGRQLLIDVERRGGSVLADAARLEQVLVDLVLNATDALPEAGGEIAIRYRETDVAPVDGGGEVAPGRYGSFIVADDGAGMDEVTRRRATEAFFTTKGRDVGSGVGLATATAFAEELGGRLDIRSSPGAGTTVEILLPVIAAVRRRRRTRAVRLVLHVDESSRRDAWAGWLRAARIQVVVASDWSDVDRCVRTEPIDGLVVAGLLPQGFSANDTLPVISLPSDATRADLTASVEELLAIAG